MPPLLEVEDLTVGFKTEAGMLVAVNRVSFDVQRGEIFGPMPYAKGINHAH